MNRESKRMMERKGQADAGALDDEDDRELAAVAVASGPARSTQRSSGRKRTTPMQFAREIRDELRQVAWPTRQEMVNYSTIVLVTLVVMTGLIFLLNLAFSRGVIFMFTK